MKKVLLILTALGLVLGSVSVAQGDTFVVEVTKNRVNLRAGGSMAHKIIAKLEPGTRLVALREVGDWFRVRIPRNIPVYISAKYVQAQDAGSGTVTGSRVNLRCTPSTQYSIVGTAERGQALRIVARQGDWLKVEPPDCARAWLYKRYVQRLSGVSPAGVSAARTAPAPAAGAAGGAPAPAEAVEEDIVLAGLYRQGLEKWLAGDLGSAKTTFQDILAKGQGKYSKLAGQQLRLISEMEDKQRRMQESRAQERIDRARAEKEMVDKILGLVKTFVEEKREEKAVYAATGVFRSMGLYIGRRGTHKLVKDGLETYHLRAAKDGVDLYDARYYGRKVGVIGRVIEDPSSHWKIIEVERLDILE